MGLGCGTTDPPPVGNIVAPLPLPTLFRCVRDPQSEDRTFRATWRISLLGLVCAAGLDQRSSAKAVSRRCFRLAQRPSMGPKVLRSMRLPARFSWWARTAAPEHGRSTSIDTQIGSLRRYLWRCCCASNVKMGELLPPTSAGDAEDRDSVAQAASLSWRVRAVMDTTLDGDHDMRASERGSAM